MAVAFDAVGPGATGTTGTASPFTWSHTCTGSDRCLIVAIAWGNQAIGGTRAVTYNGVSMTLLAAKNCNTDASTGGFIEFYGLTNPASGANTVSLTFSGIFPDQVTAGSVSFTGVLSVGTAVSANGQASNPTVNVTGTTSGNMIVDACANGQSITSSNQTQRWLRNINSNSAAGNAAQATAAAGGTVTMSYAVTQDWWAIVAVELSGAAPTNVSQVATTTGAPGAATAFTPTLPTHATGDRMILAVVGKDATTTVPTINQSWTLVKSGTGGTGTTGNDTGQTFWAVYAKDATSGSETAPTVTPGATAPNSWEWICSTFRYASGKSWADAIGTSVAWVQSASDTTTASPLTGTAGAWTGVQPTADDAVLAVGAIPTDLGTALGATTLTATGLSGGTVNAATSQYVENALGNDTAAVWASWIGFTGTASAGLAASFTVTGATNQSGSLVAIALRQATGTTPVSSTVATSWKVAGQATKTAALSANVRAEVNDTLAESWAVKTSLTDTLAESWAVKAQATKTAAETWNVRAFATGSSAQTWNVRAFTTGTSAQTWAVKTVLTQTLAESWKVRGAATQTSAQLWNVLAALTSVTSSSAQTWAVRQAITKTAAESWAVKAQATQAVAETWKVRAATTQTSAQAWAVKTTATASNAQTWAVRAAITKTAAETWNVRAFATSTSGQLWNVLSIGSVTSSLATAWNVRQAVTQIAAESWAVKTSLTKTSASTWGVRQAITQTAAETWAVKTSLTKTTAETWAVRAVATQTTAQAWNVKATITKTTAETWAVKVAITQTTAALWNVLATGSVSSTVTTSWNVRGRPTCTSAQTWNVATRLTQSSAQTWAVKTFLTQSVSETWKIRAWAIGTRATSWNVTGRATGTLATTWRVRITSEYLGGPFDAALTDGWDAALADLPATAGLYPSDTLHPSASLQPIPGFHGSLTAELAPRWDIGIEESPAAAGLRPSEALHPAADLYPVPDIHGSFTAELAPRWGASIGG